MAVFKIASFYYIRRCVAVFGLSWLVLCAIIPAIFLRSEEGARKKNKNRDTEKTGGCKRQDPRPRRSPRLTPNLCSALSGCYN